MTTRGENFDRESYDRGLQYFSTLVLQIGHGLAASDENEPECEVGAQIITDYINTLDAQGLGDLHRMIITVQSINWDRLMPYLVLRQLLVAVRDR